MTAEASPKLTNRLIHETSPYLRQHAHNPVDWYPWGEEALARAKAEDKPILLSIGYSACHWCHVMERESFENEDIAALMNEHFINVKVDREERPDLDTIYMNAVQMLTGRGGWPMTVFLTPDQVPFYGGTYFPPEDRQRMPGFPKILNAVAEAYQTQRTKVIESAREILAELQALNTPPPPTGALDRVIHDQAALRLSRNFDWDNGGFGNPPKFPGSLSHSFLLRTWHRTGDARALEMVELSLEKMAHGGMYDQIGGGFHRYSTDAKWLVPHFEKMLYDNALLTRLYLDAWVATGKPLYRRIVEETLDYVVREMTSPEGGFYSTQDADSEGVEGKFFVWQRAEVLALLGEEEGALFCRYYDISAEGNFEHANIPNITGSVEAVAALKGVTVERLEDVLARGRKILFDEREKRIKPARDEKQLTAWNGLMLVPFARAGAVLGRADYVAAARRNAEFVLANLLRDGKLLRSHKDGESKLNGYLEDYSFFIDGLLALYEATFETKWLLHARDLTDTMLDQFGDPAGGIPYFTGKDHEELISRTKDFFDNATPSGNSVAVDVLLRLSVLLGEERYFKHAEEILTALRENMARMSSAFGHLLGALDFYLSTPKEIAIVGDRDAADTKALLETVYRTYLPNRAIVCAAPDDAEAARLIPLLRDRTAIDGKATAYVCERMTCNSPVTEVAALAEQLR